VKAPKHPAPRSIVVLRRAITAAAFALTFWALLGVGPRPPLLILLIAMPWITLLLVRSFKPDLSVNGGRASDMSIGILLPGPFRPAGGDPPS
jgi:hypothetical protein